MGLTIVLYAYVAFILILGGIAACVALFVADSGRRHDAYRVLRLLISTGTGGSGVGVLMLQLHEAGLL